jgi:hypothetical protein
MTKSRADLGFGAELESFDPRIWTPSPSPTAKDHPPRHQVEQAAQAVGFRSREPAARPEPAPAQPLRRRRTGRNAQFNIKARPETIDAFCAIADAQGWGIGETLEHAVELLQRELGTQASRERR